MPTFQKPPIFVPQVNMSPFLGAVPSPYPPRFGNQLHPGYAMFTPYYGPYHPGVAPFPGNTMNVNHPALNQANPY